ncbi:MAG: tetratricopeptide repeat protein [Myxococcaceae bacterium]|nr:tetratricopeptide repeat protein [Myxococcaceae bacterium]
MLLLVAALLAQVPTGPVLVEAERLFTEGDARFRAGDLDEAERSFAKSYALLPLGATAWNLARCTEQARKHASAIGWYRRYLRLEPTAKDRKQVEAAVRTLEKRLAARGVQALTVFITPPDAQASVDAGAVAGDGATFELTAGPHALEVFAPTFVTAQLEVVVSLSASQEVAVTLTPKPPAALDEGFVLPPALDAPTTRPPPPPPVVVLAPSPMPHVTPGSPGLELKPAVPRVERRLRFTWLGAGLTVAASVTGLVAGLVAADASTQLRDGTVRSREQNTGLKGTIETGALVSNVGWVAAAVLAASTAVALGVEW